MMPERNFRKVTFGFLISLYFTCILYSYLNHSSSKFLLKRVPSAVYILRVENYLPNISLFQLPKKNKLSDKIYLSEFNETFSEPAQIFFLETSGRPNLRGRECCAVESAARNSGLKVQVILASRLLDLRITNCMREGSIIAYLLY